MSCVPSERRIPRVPTPLSIGAARSNHDAPVSARSDVLPEGVNFPDPVSREQRLIESVFLAPTNTP